jgi:hypothetical protein
VLEPADAARAIRSREVPKDNTRAIALFKADGEVAPEPLDSTRMVEPTIGRARSPAGGGSRLERTPIRFERKRSPPPPREAIPTTTKLTPRPERETTT